MNLLSKKSLTLLAIIFIAIPLDILLLQLFNSLNWPLFWPRPGIFILIAFFVIFVWFPEFISGIWLLRVLGFIMVFVGQSYLIHSYQVLVRHFSPIALLHFLGIGGTFVVMAINYVNQFNRKDNRKAPQLPTILPQVVAVIPTYGEPIPVLERTLISLKQLNYPSDLLTIIVSDDGHNDEVQALTVKHQVVYNLGPRRHAKAGNLNSVLDYIEQQVPEATLQAYLPCSNQPQIA